MNNLKLHTTVLIIISVFFMLACNENLTKPMATKLLEESDALIFVKKYLRLYPGAFEKAQKCGMASKNNFTEPEIKKYYEDIKNMGGFLETDIYLVLKENMPFDLKIDGISEVPNNQGIIEVLYSWEYIDPPSPLRRFVSKGGNGVALFKKFDTGWKIQGFKNEHTDAPFPLSEQEIALEKKDFDAYQDKLERIAEEKRIARENEKQREKYLIELKEKAKISSKTIKEYYFPGKKFEAKERNVLKDSSIIQIKDPGGMNIKREKPFLEIFAIKKTTTDIYNIPEIKLFYDKQLFVGRDLHFISIQDRDEFFSLIKKTVSEWKERFKELRAPKFLE